MLNTDCRNRLYNWKFYQAQSLLDESATEHEEETVRALAATFGNCGWFDGCMGTIVGATVRHLVEGDGSRG